jgi:hypothetical protein
MEGLRKTTKNRSLDSLSSGRDLNPGPPEYEAEVLTSQPRRSVSVGEYGVLVICLIGGNKERKKEHFKAFGKRQLEVENGDG